MTEPRPSESAESTRIAVLIDSDNVSAKHTGAILEELATYGRPTVKRAYGDWTTNRLSGWKDQLNRHAIQPIQQFAYTVGKNATDSALIIDAMDLLHLGNVDAFAIVSSDSDYTRLASRLRESGKRVFGLGARKTPESLRRAVDQFIYLELLDRDFGDQQEEAAAPVATAATVGAGSSADAKAETSGINLQSSLVKAVNASSDDEGWVNLGTLGQHLSRAHADFDTREFGHRKLSTLVASQPYLETRTAPNGATEVRVKPGRRSSR